MGLVENWLTSSWTSLYTRIAPSSSLVFAVAGIVRGLVATCDRESGPVRNYRWELLRAANWRAARSGLSGDLLSPVDGSTRPASEATEHLLSEIAPVLDERGEREEIEALTGAILTRGNGATRQCGAYRRRHQINDVIESVTLEPDGHPRGAD
jgi:carboxylate-amine ligase